ncbi:MAG: glycerol-3-phosphate dehydrogenase/oxidase [Anaerolineaceae bacterium]|nr:glycerol-3-phosphate dehydrogenase/oxidase [Anaerolineaceae bacterium]
MKRFIEESNQKEYDLIVIGGGITGASVAYEAASRGFSVALLEKNDFSAATSAATSKLIHGGLRYLANFEFGLVRESLKERRILENIAPNLVYPIPFIIPLYNNWARSKWIMEPGMIIYDLLSYDKGFTWDDAKKISWHKHISRKKVQELEPIVKTDGMTGAILYHDCTSINPERLTLAFIKSAVKLGAEVANYAKVVDFLRSNGAVEGVVVQDLLQNKSLEVRGKMIINCGGPWADLILEVATGKQNSQNIRRSEGIHIITRKLANQHCMGMMSPGGRHFNIIPWRGHSLIGTTDREYIGDPDAYEITREKIKEFLVEVNGALNEKDQIAYSDVLYTYGGLRPLVEDQTKEVYKSSRKYEIYDNEKDGLKGLITVEGGKYTTSRSLAENVVRLVVKKLGLGSYKSKTAKKYLTGSEIKNINSFIGSAIFENEDFPETTINYLARVYGTEYTDVLKIARNQPEYAASINADGEILAQVVFGIRNEMARTLTDILLRRTGIGTLGHPGKEVLQKVTEIAAEELNWDETRIEQEWMAAEKVLTVPQ